MTTDPELEQSDFYSHDGSYLRTEFEGRPESPNQIQLDESILDEAEIHQQRVLHGETQRYDLEVGDYDVKISEKDAGAVVRASSGNAVYRQNLDYFPAGEKQVKDLLAGMELPRVF